MLLDRIDSLELFDTRQGTVAYDEFEVAVAAGERIDVSLTSNAFDPVLVVAPPSAAQITNDDYQGSRNASFLDFVSSSGGVAKIRVTANSAASYGNYRLHVRRALPGSIDANSAAVASNWPVLAVGRTSDGELGPTDARTTDGRIIDEWLVPGNPARTLSLQVRAVGSNAALTALVVSFRGQVLQADVTGNIVVSGEGTHRLQVMSSTPTRYQIGANEVSPSTAAAPTLARAHHQLPLARTGAAATLGQELSGALAAGDMALPTGESADAFLVAIESNGPADFELSSAQFDPYLMVVSPAGEISEDDDSGGSRNARVSLAHAQPGTYWLIATSYRNATGSYVLKTSSGAPRVALLPMPTSPTPTPSMIPSMTPIPSQTPTAALTPSSPGATLIPVGPSATATQPNGGPGVSSPSASLVPLPSSGSGNSAGSRVDSQVTSSDPLARSIRGALAQGDRTLPSGEFVDEHHFAGLAGKSFRVRLQSSSFDSYLIVQPPSGPQVDNDDASSGVRDSLVEIPMGQPGDYKVLVTSYRAAERGAYELRVEEGPPVPGAVAVAANASGNPNAGASQGVAPGAAPRVFGLFAGITDYPDDNDLSECANDARKLAETMRGQGLLGPGQETLLTDSQATVGAVRGALSRLSSEMRPNDVFVFFYSGHGGRTEGSRDSREIDGADEFLQLYDGALSDDELATLFDSLRAGTSVIALDACFSGGFAKDLITRPGRVGLFSSEEDVTSSVADRFQAGGYLSHFLRLGLSGQADADPQDRVLTVGELTHYTWSQFGRHASDVRMSMGYQHLVVDRGAVSASQVLWAVR